MCSPDPFDYAVTQASPGRDPAAPGSPGGSAVPDHRADAPGEVALTRPAPEVVRHGPGVPAGTAPAEHPREGIRPGPGVAAKEVGARPPDIVRYGLGVPVTPRGGRVELTAERAWHPPPAKRAWRLRHPYRLLGSALTMILLAASGVLLYQRFHHTPLRVTSVVITQQAPAACGVSLTGRITTNGAEGTVAYQWLFQPDAQPPRPLSQSVTAGQHALYLTIAVDGSGQGSATQTVTLQVLSPGLMTTSITVPVRCR
jgi:hypothetical protein